MKEQYKRKDGESVYNLLHRVAIMEELDNSTMEVLAYIIPEFIRYGKAEALRNLASILTKMSDSVEKGDGFCAEARI